LNNAIIQKVLFEIEQVDEHINASRQLVDLCKIREPNYTEKYGAAMVLHSFYNGIENIMLLIVKGYDREFYNGMQWHKDLLAKAFEGTENRTPIFRKELYDSLKDYLMFRHLVRHLYGFQLEWRQMKDKLFNMDTVWKDVKEDINTFIVIQNR